MWHLPYRGRSVVVGGRAPIARGRGVPTAAGPLPPEQSTAVSLLDRLLHHAIVVATEGEEFRMKGARAKGGPKKPKIT